MPVLEIKTQFQLTKYIIKYLTEASPTANRAISSSAKLLLLCIADYMNPSKGWQAYPSIPELSLKAMMSESTTKRALAVLVRAGVIVKDVGYAYGKTSRTNYYNIDLKVLSHLTGVDAVFVGKVFDVTTKKKGKPNSKATVHGNDLANELDDELDGEPFPF